MMVLEGMEPSGSDDDYDDDQNNILPTEKASHLGSPQAQPAEGIDLQKGNIIPPTSQTSLAMEEEEEEEDDEDDDDDDVGDLPSLTLYHREDESRNPDSEFNDDRMLLLLDDYDDEFHHGDNMENVDAFYNTFDSPAPYDQPTRYLNVFPNDRYYYFINHHHVTNESRTNTKMVPSLEPIASFDSSESTTTSFSGSSSSSSSSDDKNRHAVVSSSTCTSGGKTGGVEDHHHGTIPLSKQQRPNAAYDSSSSSMAYDTGVSLIDNTILDSSVEESEDNIVFLMEQLDKADADLQTEEEPKRNPTVPVMTSTTNNNKNDCNNEYNAILSSLFCGGGADNNGGGGGVSSVGARPSSSMMMMTMTTPSSPKLPSWLIEETNNNANYENDGTIESSSSAVCTAVGTDEGLEYSLEAFLGYGRGQNLVVQPLSEDL
jgi:hypothetical protein